MPLRCVYTDLDGTLLGKFGALLRDAEGAFSRAQTLALEACHRAEVEVVLKSGRREAQVLEDARLIGQSSYIYEAGCGVVIDLERTHLTDDWVPHDGVNPADRMIAEGIPELLFERFPGRLEWHSPWATGRELSLLFRGKVEVAAANETLAEHGHDGLRFLDNGAIGRPMEGIDVTHAYHLVPRESSKARAVRFHQRARGYAAQECIAIGDSLEDLGVAPVVGRFFMVANGPEKDAGVRAALADHPNVTVTDGRNGDGFYEAVISSLAEGRAA